MLTKHGLQTHRFEVFADYHQMYLEDSQTQSIEDRSEGEERVKHIDARVARLLTAEALARHLGVAPGIVCLLTARPMTVPVEVILQSQAPANDFQGWDRVVEASLDVPSGCLIIHGPSDYLPAAPRLTLQPGTYRVRAYFGGLGTVSADGLEGDDHYRVALWLAPAQEPVILLAQDSGRA